jgi:hypothetical protein
MGRPRDRRIVTMYCTPDGINCHADRSRSKLVFIGMRASNHARADIVDQSRIGFIEPVFRIQPPLAV